MQKQVRFISISSLHKQLQPFSSEFFFYPHLEAKREEREESELFSPMVVTKSLNNSFYCSLQQRFFFFLFRMIHVLHYEGESAPIQRARK